MPEARALRVPRRLACTVLCAGALLGPTRTASGQPAAAPTGAAATPADAAYYAGKLVRFTPAAAKHGRTLVVGNALLGPLFSARKPKDHRPNVYIVCPGTQHRSYTDGDAPAFNLVLNSLPQTGDAVEWDVYWAVVLDPKLRRNFISERELLLAAQDSFSPGELFEFGEIPGAALLRKYLHIESVAGLAPFRRHKGALPRLVIVPSHLVIRASALDTNAPPAPSRASRALSHLSGGHVPAENVKK